VPLAEIEANDFNLNIPRYIDSSEPEDLQDIEAHLHGGIPNGTSTPARLLGGVPGAARTLFAPPAPATAPASCRRPRSSPPSSATPNSPPSPARDAAVRAWRTSNRPA
jgi:type I restriction enzyme M protein